MAIFKHKDIADMTWGEFSGFCFIGLFVIAFNLALVYVGVRLIAVSLGYDPVKAARLGIGAFLVFRAFFK